MPRKYLCKNNMTLRWYVRRYLRWHFEIWRVLSPSTRKLWTTLVAVQNRVTTQNRSRFSRRSRLSDRKLPRISRMVYTYSIHRTMETIASTANVMKVAALARVPRRWRSEGYLLCQLAISPNRREKTLESRPEAKRDSSSSGTTAILCLQREGPADIRLSHQRVCLSLKESKR